MNISRLAALGLLMAGVSTMAFAATPIGAPEIDPSMGLNALALLGGLAVVIRSSRRK